MKGKYQITVQNNRLRYDFEIRRNITVIQGDSATGKTTLIQMLRQAANLGDSSGIELSCKVPCLVLEGADWKAVLRARDNVIFFSDEENGFIHTEEFAREVQNSSNYYVLVTRENLYNLPYSVEEIYGIHTSGKYLTTQRTYQTFYQIYPYREENIEKKPDRILVEDSNAGYEFFTKAGEELKIPCESAGGKSGLFKSLIQSENENIYVVADGAALGAEMERLDQTIRKNHGIRLYLPESFEWIILKSGIIDGNRIQEILNNPEEYIDSEKYFSWERYFYSLLVQETRETYLQYSKSRLNPSYLHERTMQKILKQIRWLDEQPGK